MNITFTTTETVARKNELLRFLQFCEPPFENMYPGFDKWLTKISPELEDRRKEAILCVESHDIIGSLIFQKAKHNTRICEIKNIAVHKTFRKMKIGTFLLKWVEVMAHGDFAINQLQVETKHTNIAMRNLLQKSGYKVFIYGDNDLTYTKGLR